MTENENDSLGVLQKAMLEFTINSSLGLALVTSHNRM